MLKTYDSRGRLTAYALGCGSVMQVKIGLKPAASSHCLPYCTQVRLWREHCIYHVRAHEFNGRGRLFWDSFHTLKEARKRFSAAVAEYRKQVRAEK